MVDLTTPASKPTGILPVVDRSEVLSRRLAAQQLSGARAATAVEVVRRLTCVQSQEHAHAFWSLGMRTAGLDADAVRAEFDAGTFLRTHILRPTWHFVVAEDLRWILAATTERVQRANGTMLRREGLDEALLGRGAGIVADALAGHRHLTRAELGRVLAASGLPGQGLGLVYVLMQAELEALICSGPMRGSTHTYALVDERVPAAAHRQGDLAELARRFFVGHGPASEADLRRWASLTAAQSRQALAETSSGLASVEVDGTRLWFDPDGPDPAPTDEALLLPLFDEATLTYASLGFPVAAGHPHAPGTDQFVGNVVLDGTNVGTWRRELKGRRVEVALDLAPGAGDSGRRRAEQAAERLAAFLGRELVLQPQGPVTGGPSSLQ